MQPTLRDLGIRWYYWLIVALFGAAGIVAFIAIKSEPENRSILIGCGSLFGTISLLAFLWPVLRIREKQGARFTSLRSNQNQYHGLFIPASKVKYIIGLIGGSVFGLGGLLIALFADTLENRIKGGVAFAGYAGFVAAWLYGSATRVQGILLAKDGIVWHETFLAPCFIPWNKIREARQYSHREQYGTAPSFGLTLRNLEALQASNRTRKKLAENWKRFGWHLYHHAESLLLPLATVERTVVFYLQNAEAREELATRAALDRISNF